MKWHTKNLSKASKKVNQIEKWPTKKQMSLMVIQIKNEIAYTKASELSKVRKHEK